MSAALSSSIGMSITPASVEFPGAGEAPLELAVGCTFDLECMQATSAIMQVAPRPGPGVSIRQETWDTDAEHHCYVDHYRNRCERFELEPGETRIAYDATASLPHPANVIEPTAPHDKFFAKVSDMGDRAAEAGEAHLGEGEQHLER